MAEAEAKKSTLPCQAGGEGAAAPTGLALATSGTPAASRSGQRDSLATAPQAAGRQRLVPGSAKPCRAWHRAEGCQCPDSSVCSDTHRCYGLGAGNGEELTGSSTATSRAQLRAPRPCGEKLWAETWRTRPPTQLGSNFYHLFFNTILINCSWLFLNKSQHREQMPSREKRVLAVGELEHFLVGVLVKTKCCM